MCDYRKATEPDLYKVKANKLQVEDHLKEIKQIACRVMVVKERFSIPDQSMGGNINDAAMTAIASMNYKIKGLVEAVQNAGHLLRDFDDTVARLATDS